MDSQIISYVVQNPGSALWVLMLLIVLFILRKNEKQQQIISEDSKAREECYNDLVHKVMTDAKDREDKYQDIINTTLKNLTSGIHLLSNNICDMNKKIDHLTERVDNMEEK